MPRDSLLNAREINRLVTETFSIIANTPVEPCQPVPLWTRKPIALACVHIVGGWSGTFGLIWNQGEIRQVAEAVLGIPASQITETQVADCLRELANMVGGNLKPLIGNGAILSPPKLSFTDCFRSAQIGGKEIEELWFRAANWNMQFIVGTSDFSLKELWSAHSLGGGVLKDETMKILIVEDDPISQKVLANILNGYGEVQVANNGMEAQKLFSASLASSKPFDLVCLDIMMPEIPGVDVLKNMRKEEASHGIHGLAGAKVIMTSSLDDGGSVLGSFRAGCEAYIVKPIDRSKLLDTVLKLFGDRISKGQ